MVERVELTLSKYKVQEWHLFDEESAERVRIGRRRREMMIREGMKWPDVEGRKEGMKGFKDFTFLSNFLLLSHEWKITLQQMIPSLLQCTDRAKGLRSQSICICNLFRPSKCVYLYLPIRNDDRGGPADGIAMIHPSLLVNLLESMRRGRKRRIRNMLHVGWWSRENVSHPFHSGPGSGTNALDTFPLSPFNPSSFFYPFTLQN